MRQDTRTLMWIFYWRRMTGMIIGIKRHFVHPYYFIPPKGIFLGANIKVHPNAIYTYLEIDEKFFTDYTVIEHLRTHLHSLNIDMRLQNAIVSFLQIEIVDNCTNETTLWKNLH